MQKIVLDTNVVVASLISNGIPFKIINELAFENKVTVCISGPIFEEYVEVLSRPKFSVFKDFKSRAETFITKIQEVAVKYSPDIKLNVISDEADNRFLELSVYAKADYLITGNTNDFTEDKYENVDIVTPREYWDNHSE
ncbi:MAG: putative toxin-antitoxin system toxin component, PIN family [Leptospiraceae bacterium]|nr:putative toxin-antitoxin system toxin component, PIN family [Leptospiraceae bacterium]MBP9889694.1 putative toxin-antitoxin system toxin component, PIN family [Leptospiraceae bacterium]